MKAIKLTIPEVVLFEPTIISDERGYFYESYSKKAFEEATGLAVEFVQENHSKSNKGVLRGIHYQLAPKAQGKLVKVVKGEIFDVAVDIRVDSPTYGQWVGEYISAENNKQLWVPAGFAHAFLAMTDCIVNYKCTEVYSPEYERIIHWNSTFFNIKWPEIHSNIVLSEKDEQAGGWEG